VKKPFEIAGISAAPGKREERVLELNIAGVATKLPLFVLNGAHEGKTLVVTAAIHGAEYVGAEAAYRLARQTDPATLHGQLVVAPVSSMTAFKKRAIYLCPPDDKNLNRLFPGDPAGSFAQQLAHWIFQNLIRRADVYLDLHGGDMNEALVPFSILRRSGNAELDGRALALAQAFGLPNIVTSLVRGSTTSAAGEAGICAVLTEVGGQGLWPEEQVQQMYEGLRRSLVHVGLTPDASVPPAPPARLLEEMVWMRSAHDGLFHPSVAIGAEVKAGQNLGRVSDYLGNTLQEVNAPASGIILFLVTTLAMNNNDPLLAVGT
jgi:uncharacterized protein